MPLCWGALAFFMSQIVTRTRKKTKRKRPRGTKKKRRVGGGKLTLDWILECTGTPVIVEYKKWRPRHDPRVFKASIARSSEILTRKYGSLKLSTHLYRVLRTSNPLPSSSLLFSPPPPVLHASQLHLTSLSPSYTQNQASPYQDQKFRPS